MLRSGRAWALAAIALFFTILAIVGQTTYPSGVFNPSAGLNAARNGAAAAVLADGAILITGGTNSSGALNSAEMVARSSVASMTTARSGHASVALKDGRVLVAGGLTAASAPTNSAEIFNPAANSWTQVLMSAARSGATATLLADGRVVVIGGDGAPGGAHSTIEIFDPATNSFASGGALSTFRTNHAAALLNDGRIVIAGGSNGTAPVAEIDIYDPAAASVTVAGAMGSARQGLSASTLLHGKVLLAGGNDGSADLASTEIFDPSNNSVAAGPAMSVAHNGHAALVLPNNNTVLMTGGSTTSSAAEIFVEWQNAFAPFGTLSSARTAVAAGASGQTGAASVAGGVDSTGAASAAVDTVRFPMVKTDKPDYQPGNTATITGSGFGPNETVNISLVEVPDDGDGPHNLTPTTDSTGAFSTTFAIDESDLNVRFYLTAAGGTSGLTAGMTFTDAAPYKIAINATAGATGGTFLITYVNNGTQTKNASQTTNLANLTVDPGSAFSITSIQSPVNGENFLGTIGVVTATTGSASISAGTIAGTAGSSGDSMTITLNYSANVSTTTAVNSSLNPSVYGQSVSFMATITPTAATGAVQFVVDGTNFGTPVTVSGGSATSGSTSSLSAGNHTVTANFVGTGVYTNSSGSLSGGQTVNQMAVTLTAGSYGPAAYDGNTHALSACASSAPTFVTCTNNPAGPVGPDVGGAAVSPTPVYGQGVAADYNITSNNGSWSITTLPVTLTGGSYGPAAYDGNTHALSACASSAPTFVTCTNNPAGPVGPDVGGAAVSPTPVYAQGIAGDYNITSKNGAWSITTLAVTLTAGSYGPAAYDGNTHALSACGSTAPTFVTCTNNPVGPVGPDVGGVAVSPTPVYAQGIAGDYNITSNNGAWSITPLAVTITGGSYSAAYDGSAHAPSACTSSYAGVSCTNNPSSVGPDVGSGAVAPVSNIVTGIPADYTITPKNGAWSITALPVTLTGGSYGPAAYDGTTHALSACASSAPTFVTCTNNPAGPVGPDVGGAAVGPTPVYGQGVAADYSITSNNGSWSITALPVTVTGGSYGPAAYDGNTHALSACASTSASLLSCTNSPVGPVGPDVGGTAVIPTPVFVKGSAIDYTITSNNGAWSITPLAVTITGGSYSAAYDGSAHAPSACTSSYAGVSCTNNPSSVGPDVGSGAVAPVSNVVTGIPADYTITPKNGAWSITALPVTLTGGSYGPAAYDGNTHALSACASTSASLLSCTNSPVGPVGPGVGGTAVSPTPVFVKGSAIDYTVTNNNGAWSITAAPVTFTAGSYTGFWDGSAHSPSTCMVSGAYTGPLTCTNNPASVGPAVSTGTVNPVPNYGGDSSSNYTPTLKTGSWVINLDTTSLTFTGTDLGPTSTVLTDLTCATTVSANLSNVIFSTGVNGATVSFTLTGGSPLITPIVITGTTDASGNVKVQCPVNLTPGAYTLTIAYAGSSTLAPVTIVQPVTVIANPHIAPGPNAGTLYTGSRFVWTTSPTTSTATLALSATIQDSNPCVFTDITRAKISFWISTDGTNFSPVSNAQNLPVGLVDPNNHALGTASATSQYNLGNNLSAQLWVRVTVGGEYSYSGDDFDVPVLVAVPGQVNTLLAGGSLANDGSSVAGATGFGASGYLGTAASALDEADFGGSVTYGKKLSNPQGQLTVTIHSMNKADGTVDTVGHTYWAKSNSISGLNIQGTSPATSTASFTAKYNLYETTGGAKTGLDSGALMQFTFTPRGGTYTVTTGTGGSQTQNFTCNDPNGCASIVIFRSAGGVWFSSAWGSVGGLAQTLEKGLAIGGTYVQ